MTSERKPVMLPESGRKSQFLHNRHNPYGLGDLSLTLITFTENNMLP